MAIAFETISDLVKANMGCTAYDEWPRDCFVAMVLASVQAISTFSSRKMFQDKLFEPINQFLMRPMGERDGGGGYCCFIKSFLSNRAGHPPKTTSGQRSLKIWGRVSYVQMRKVPAPPRVDGPRLDADFAAQGVSSIGRGQWMNKQPT
jgi:hypothetical protein